MVGSLGFAIFWLVVEIGVLIALWGSWGPRENFYFGFGMGVAISLQLYTIGHIYWKNKQTNKMLRDILQDAEDALDDAMRQPGNNTPYERYLKSGAMKSIDQARHLKNLKPERREDDVT